MMELKKVDPNDLLIIITTSPIQSNPSTEVIDMAIKSIFDQPSLREILIHIICDGVKMTEEQSKFKSGLVSQQSFEKYEEYKKRLKEKYKEVPNIVIQERIERYCFSGNIKHVMKKYSQPFVLVFQHDHIFERIIDINILVETMKKYPINYIGFMNKSVSKLPFTLDQNMNLRKYFAQKVKYLANGVKHVHQEFVQKVLQHYHNLYGLPLMPLIFWYDKVHIAKRDYYLDVIFNEKGFYDEVKKTRLKTVSFVEDSFGCSYRRSIQSRPAKFQQLMSFILWDSSQSAIYHIHGRNFITSSEKDALHQKHLNEKFASSSEEEVSQEENLGLESLEQYSFL